jgi:hypothetical protein
MENSTTCRQARPTRKFCLILGLISITIDERWICPSRRILDKINGDPRTAHLEREETRVFARTVWAACHAHRAGGISAVQLPRMQIPAPSAPSRRCIGIPPEGKRWAWTVTKSGSTRALFAQRGEVTEEKKPTASRSRSGRQRRVTLETAVKLLSLPSDRHPPDGVNVFANIGRYGPYIKRRIHVRAAPMPILGGLTTCSP